MLTDSLSFKRVSHLFAVISVTATLAACGGGSDAPAPAPAPPPAPPAGGAPAPVPEGSAPAAPAPTTSPLARLQGTWSDACDNIVQPANPTVGLLAINASDQGTIVFSAPAADGSVTARVVNRFYSSINCTGPAIATVSQNTLTFTANGLQTVGAITANRVDIAITGGLPSFTGSAARQVAAGDTACGGIAAVVVNLGTAAQPFNNCFENNPPSTIKSLIGVNAAGNLLNLEDDNNPQRDPQGYPTRLSPANEVFTKQ